MISKAVVFSRDLIINTLRSGENAVDATAGNGNDTVFLSSLVGDSGKVYAFDIQEEAIVKTGQKLQNGSLQNVILVNDGHENMDKHVTEQVGAVMFNLGYLPGGNHSIVTKPDSTVKAVKKALNLLREKGMITIVCYCGHPGGPEERDSLIKTLKMLDQKKYQVLHYRFINQINNPPELIAIEKL